ncbi:MAG: FlgD immunoglobulin-like domain containing protein [Candidatus Krumholzibacteriia bacterium]
MATSTHPVRMPRRRRARLTAPCGAVLGLALLLGTAAAQDKGPLPVRTDELLPGVTATIHPDGRLEVLRSGSDEPLLAAGLEPADRGRRLRPVPGGGALRPHLGRAAEGCPGGHRGFSADADDDGDGLVDEDRLDGLDNDGDGLVDEDFAAVSDAMIAVSRPGTAGGAHLEYYRWGYARLQPVVFASAAGDEGSRWAMVTGGTPWLEVKLATAGHTVTGRPVEQTVTAFVSQVQPDGDCRRGNRWLGVAVLDEPGSGRVGRAVLDGRELAVGTGPAPVAVAVCAADSWFQLSHLLTEARRIRAGVVDPVTGERAPWIVAPACPQCRGAEAPRYAWRLDRGGDLVLTAKVGKGTGALPDPDLLRLGDLNLGAPDRLSWQPTGGEEIGVAWSCVTAASLARGTVRGGDPYAALPGVRVHGAAGRLELRFSDPAPDLVAALTDGPGGGRPPREVTQVTADGRVLVAELGRDLESEAVQAALALARDGAAAEPSSPARQSQLLRTGRVRAQLSPDLLQGWPNPFQDVISVRFQVPATIGEAFVWDEADDWPAGLDLAAPVPWKQGSPGATVKVYTMSGQELVTLFSGDTGPGETVLTWDGTDAYGRKMASGTYFCKLQLDEWSVTRRLVYLR